MIKKHSYIRGSAHWFSFYKQHVLSHSSFCIDLTLTNQPNFWLWHTPFPTSHCHYQFIYLSVTSNLSIHKLTNILFTISKTPIVMLLKKLMKESIGNFWCSEKNVHDQVIVFNQTLMNVFSNFITNKLIAVDDKKSFMAPFYRWGLTASRLQSHYKEAVYFLRLSSQKFLVVI